MKFSLASQLKHEVRSLVAGYPDFVYSGKSPAGSGHVPVFVYHTVEPAGFEADLRYLAENGYTSIGMNELAGYMRGDEVLPDRPVVLTFDDARSSFWRFGYPLLQQFEMKGVLFAIPGLTEDAPDLRPTIESVWNGGRSIEEVRSIDPDDRTLCTWPELRAMHASGWVEVESHSLFHRELFTEPDILDILTPNSSYVPYQTPATAYLTHADIGHGIRPARFYGCPVLPSASLHCGLPAWEVPSGVLESVREHWSTVLGPEDRPERLKERALEYVEQQLRSNPLEYRSEAEVSELIAADLDTARQLLKAHVDTSAGDHLCLPYGVGSERSLEVQRRLGIQSCSWGVASGSARNGSETDPMKISRVKSDFLWRLPGAGQKSLLRVYGDKVKRRLHGDRIY